MLISCPCSWANGPSSASTRECNTAKIAPTTPSAVTSGGLVRAPLASRPRPPDHLGDGHARVADLFDRLDRRREHAAALDLGDLAARGTVRARPRARARARVVREDHQLTLNPFTLVAAKAPRAAASCVR